MNKMLYAVLILLAAAPVAGYAYEGTGAAGIHDPAEGFNHLWKEVLVDITIIGVFFSIVTVYLLLKYRRRHPDQEGRPPRLTPTQVLGWGLIPVFVFLADDFFLAAKGWTLWNNYRTVPENHYEVQLESQMWMGNFKYPGGGQTVNELRVPAGKPILVRLTRRAVSHSMFLPAFR